jgi:hypothetical protein
MLSNLYNGVCRAHDLQGVAFLNAQFFHELRRYEYRGRSKIFFDYLGYHKCQGGMFMLVTVAVSMKVFIAGKMVFTMAVHNRSFLPKVVQYLNSASIDKNQNITTHATNARGCFRLPERVSLDKNRAARYNR